MEMMQERMLNSEQAYRAMFYFLEREYERTGADEIGGLLSSLSWEITQGNGPADPRGLGGLAMGSTEGAVDQ
ncbi:hypothetical protein [Achromobacter sp. DH1f]|uniref:hypothetical protein n=1 Tax=Achromobacter sp. DH1f TaxID=1397275 RepID=UPI0018E3721F|nr:hypothetical protein [Achromobacter sp. DH1f]